MYKKAIPFFIKCETPAHVGSGSDLGIVDLPIQRERHTSFPKIEASSLKGALRERFEGLAGTINPFTRINIQLAFGYDPSNETPSFKESFEKNFESQYAGAMAFTDARLLLFPVKSLKGVFAYITCPAVLQKFSDDLLLATNTMGTSPEKIETFMDALDNFGLHEPKSNECFSMSKTLLVGAEQDYRIVLEEYVFRPSYKFKTEWQGGVLVNALKKVLPISFDIKDKLVILNNNDFKDFVNLSTEVITRTKINNETGTVAKGALFTEEYLPTESILYNLVMAGPIFQSEKTKQAVDNYFFNDDGKTEEEKVLNYFKGGIEQAKNKLQIGGNATLGKGIISVDF